MKESSGQMQQYIKRLLEGKFEYDKGCLEFDSVKIEHFVKCGEFCEGSFAIHGAKGYLTQGQVYSSMTRMKVLNPDFLGNGEEIHYQFDATDVEEGDVFRGQFDVISNQGEYYLPFVITVEHSLPQSSLGTIKNLFHFANLAKSNWQEAVGLFYSSSFRNMLGGTERTYLGLYQGLQNDPENEQNVEEFLIGIKKKQRIEYLFDRSEVVLEDPEEVKKETVVITKNGWGYTRLEVSCEGDFIHLEKKCLKESDFLGNCCYLDFYIDNEKLHAGCNYGKLVVSSALDHYEILICVRKTQKAKDTWNRHQLYNEYIKQIMTFYEDFRLKKIGTSVWLTQTKELVDKLHELDDRDIMVKLFHAQLLITEERYHEARWLLDHIEDYLEGRRVEPEIACYYLYLTSLNSREEDYVDQIAEEVAEIYEQYRENWRIAWLILYLDENYSRSSTKKWLFLEEQFEKGCNSPLFYVEAILLLQQNPALLTKLGRFEQSVLWYGVKRQVLQEDLVRQILSIATQSKAYSTRILAILKGCYEYQPSVEALQLICGFLIKGNVISREAFYWYKLGVEREVRVTRLYEYYMLSMDLAEEEEIPRMVMMYFSYQNELSYRRSARLYAQIVRNAERYPEIFHNFREQMERFVLEQIDREHINRDLAFLYAQLLTPQMIQEDNAASFSRLLFMNMVQTDFPGARKVIVLHEQAKGEQSYPIKRGVGYVPIYTQDYMILIEDEAGNRYHASVTYNMEKLLIPGKYAKYIMPFHKTTSGFAVYVCESSRSFLAPNEDNLAFYQAVMEDEVLDEHYKAQTGVRMLGYLYENDNMRELDWVLERINLSVLRDKDREQVIQYLVLRGLFDKAYGAICSYGTESVDSKTLQKLCVCLIDREDFVPSPQMTELCAYALERGRFDVSMLEYLMVNYNGLSKKMRDIWKQSKEQNLNCHVMEERLLKQLLYTGAYVGEKQEIFRSYLGRNFDTELAAAFLAQCSYDYFVKEKIMPEFVFEQIENMYLSGKEVQKICMLAYTKYYAADGKEAAEEHMECIGHIVKELLGQGVVLPCFADYAENVPALRHFFDRTVVEYHSHPNSRVTIHYVMEREQGQDTEYVTEDMMQVFEGVCTKEFVLFFGESLQYYIMEEHDGEEQLTESAQIRKSDIGKEVLESRFSKVNDLVISQNLEDYATLDSMLEEYYQKDYYADHLFRLL